MIEYLRKCSSLLSTYELFSLVWWAGWDSNPRPPPRQSMHPSNFVKKIADNLKKIINEELVNRELQIYRQYLETKNLAKKTIDTHVQYLRRFLRLGLPLNVESIIAFLSSMNGYARVHAVRALRHYFRLKERKDLLEIIKTPRINEEPITYCPSLSEVKAVAEKIEWPPAQAYYVLLAESGLRPGEVYSLKLTTIDLNTRISELRIQGIDIENRVLAPLKTHGSKRAFCSFYSNRDLIRNYIEKYCIKNKLFPFSRKKLRQAIYQAMEKALGRRFELYALRRFWTTEMHKRKMNPLTIDLLQGRKPKIYRIMLSHYLKLTIKDLRNEYDQTKIKII